jgi:putative oxidoreductase
MNIRNKFDLPSLFLRLALGIPFLWFVADRLGFLGTHGSPHVGWGDWPHFLEYASQVMSFFPARVIPFFAILATIGEFTFGFLLVVGCFTRMAAIGSGTLSFLFAISMAISFGIESPLGYSVFTVSAASFLLAVIPSYSWSIDEWYLKRKKKFN